MIPWDTDHRTSELPRSTNWSIVSRTAGTQLSKGSSIFLTVAVQGQQEAIRCYARGDKDIRCQADQMPQPAAIQFEMFSGGESRTRLNQYSYLLTYLSNGLAASAPAAIGWGTANQSQTDTGNESIVDTQKQYLRPTVVASQAATLARETPRRPTPLFRLT